MGVPGAARRCGRRGLRGRRRHGSAGRLDLRPGAGRLGALAVPALSGGDISVRTRGYLTLNPFRYLNATYSIVIPVVILAIGGIPLPGGAVLIENHRLRTRGWSSLVSLAGPLTNLVLGVVLVLVPRALPI